MHSIQTRFVKRMSASSPLSAFWLIFLGCNASNGFNNATRFCVWFFKLLQVLLHFCNFRFAFCFRTWRRVWSVQLWQSIGRRLIASAVRGWKRKRLRYLLRCRYLGYCRIGRHFHAAIFWVRGNKSNSNPEWVDAPTVMLVHKLKSHFVLQWFNQSCIVVVPVIVTFYLLLLLLYYLLLISSHTSLFISFREKTERRN